MKTKWLANRTCYPKRKNSLNVMRVRCNFCKEKFDIDTRWIYKDSARDYPTCPHCGAQVDARLEVRMRREKAGVA